MKAAKVTKGVHLLPNALWNNIVLHIFLNGEVGATTGKVYGLALAVGVWTTLW